MKPFGYFTFRLLLHYLVFASLLLFQASLACALPANGEVEQGGAEIRYDGSTMVIKQTTPTLILTWGSLDIAQDETVSLEQPSATAVAVIRVTGNDPTSILGRLKANGMVFLVNPNGMVFAAGSRIEVGGVVASALDAKADDFASGRYSFSGAGSAASVVNRGRMTAAPGGCAILLGARVENDGVIAAPQGSVALAAGSAATLHRSGSGLWQVGIGTPVQGARVQNAGAIRADAGTVVLSGRDRDARLARVVDNSGVIEALSLGTQTGAIVLDGGEFDCSANTGRLDASGRNPGQQGGSVKVLGYQVDLGKRARIDVSGDCGGGTALIGGNFQGKGPEQKASATSMDQGAVIAADALTSGNGGKVAIWGNDSLRMDGSISARGGVLAGDGGFVETSSHGGFSITNAPNVGAANGKAGSWLIDPRDLVIDNNTDANVNGSTPFSPSGAGAHISWGTINAGLLTGDVTVTTVGTGGTGAGDITFGAAGLLTSGNNLTISSARDLVADNALTRTASGNLTLTAARNVALNDSITLSAASQLNLTATAGAIGQAAGTVTAGSLTTVSGGAANFGNVNLSGTLSVTAGGEITQGPMTALTVAYDSAINAGVHGITLDQGNRFGGPIALRNSGANNVLLANTVPTMLAGSSVGGSLVLTSGGSISQTGALVVGASTSGNTTATVTAPGSDVLLGYANNLAGVVTISAAGVGSVRDVDLRNINPAATTSVPGALRNLTLTIDNTSVVLPTQTVTGTLSVGTGYTVFQAGKLTVGGPSFFAAAETILLNLSGNAFTESVSLQTASANNVQLSNGLATVLGTCSLGGNLNVSSGGAIALTGVIATPGQVALVANGKITESGNGAVSNASILGTQSVGGQTLKGPNTVSGFSGFNSGGGTIELVNSKNVGQTIISGTPAGSAPTGSAYSFTPTASNATSFSISGKPSWASFNTSNGTLSGTPGAGDTGSFGNIVITASKGLFSASLAAFSIAVTTPTPTVTGVPSSSATVGAAYSFIPTSTNATSFSISGRPGWASFNTATGALTGTPVAPGSHPNIVISASNAGGSVSLPAFTITVVVPAPTISGTPATSATVGIPYSFTPVATDAASFSIAGSLPQGLSFDTATGALSGTPTTAGSFGGLQISAGNASGSASLAPFTITVNPALPTIAGVPPNSGIKISSGYSHNLMLKADGTLWAWGDNTYGQLGDGTTIRRYTPVQVGSGYASMSVGQQHSVALKTDGTLWTWGWNGNGQLGDGSKTQRNAPVQIGSGYASVAAGEGHTLGLKADGTLWACGYNGRGNLGDGTTTDKLVPVQVGSGFASVSAGGYHNAALKSDGTLWTWGWNLSGQLGDGTITDKIVPTQVGSGYAFVSAGKYHTMALKSGGSLWAFGRNMEGELGDGTISDYRLLPVQVGQGFASVSAGHLHTAALKADGTLLTWGLNYYGQLGDGTTTDKKAPVPVGPGYASMSAGGEHTVAVKGDGTLWAWGMNDSGQLGDGTTTGKVAPVQIGSGSVAVSATTVGTYYSFTPTATDATSFGISGVVAPGLIFDAGSGTLSGTPTAAGVYGDIRISASNVSGSAQLAPFTIVVAKAYPYISSWPAASPISYGQTLASSTLTGGSASVAGSFAWATPGAVPGTGAPTQGVTFTPDDTANYKPVTAGVDVVVNKATPSITAWPSATGISFGQALAASTLSGGAGSVAGSFSFSDTATVPSAAGSYTAAVTFTPTDTPHYNPVTGTVVVAVDKAYPQISAWPAASPISYGQTLASSTLTGGSASVAGSFAWATPGAVPATGAPTQGVTFSPSDASNYHTVSGTVSVTVGKASPYIAAWPSASPISYGQTLASSTLTGGSASVPGSFAWTTPDAVPGTGAPTQGVTFTPNDTANYLPVTAGVDVVVNKATPSITAWPSATGIILGQALAASTLSGGAASVAGSFAFSSPSAAPSATGSYSAAVTFTPADLANYLTASGSVTVAVASNAVNGACGVAHGASYLVSPSQSLCSVGAVSAVSGSGPWSWSCAGQNGGTTASCSSSKLAHTIPTPAAGPPSANFAGGKGGTTFTVTRSEAAGAASPVYTGSSTSFTDTAPLKANTIYQYAVSSDSDPSRTIVMTVRTPLYNGWNIVAVPYETTGVSSNLVFASPVSAVYQWTPSGASAEGSNAVLGSYRSVGTLLPGNGYFVKASNNSTLLAYTGNPGPASATVVLKPGWTMIANPQTANKTDIGANWLIDGVPLYLLVEAGKIGGGIYWWNGTTYDSWTILGDNPQIEPWKGYWIVNLESVDHTLTIR